MSHNVFEVMYDDDHVLLEAAKKLTSRGIKIRDVFSPFPVHGIDPVIGVKPTRLGDAAFVYGLTGLTLAMTAITYFMIIDWPMNIGGKPSFSLFENIPAFVPVMFEFTVLCAAHGMALTYLIVNNTLPGMKPRNPDPRTTDDKFVMQINTSDNKKFTAQEIRSLIEETPVYELKIKKA